MHQWGNIHGFFFLGRPSSSRLSSWYFVFWCWLKMFLSDSFILWALVGWLSHRDDPGLYRLHLNLLDFWENLWLDCITPLLFGFTRRKIVMMSREGGKTMQVVTTEMNSWCRVNSNGPKLIARTFSLFSSAWVRKVLYKWYKPELI